MTINELLLNRGLKSSDKVKFVRHKDNRALQIINNVEYNGINIYDMYRQESTRHIFMRYQCEQSKDVFKGTDYIVSFIGEKGTLARFIGVYKINGCSLAELGKSKFLYDMEEMPGFEDLKERVIVDWGASTLSWHQWMQNEKEIVEIGMPLNQVHFTSYHDFILDRSQFEKIFDQEYPEWKRALSTVNCVYLISDKNTGMQYIGSTYGKDGIWGRWIGYYRTIHNGNKKLIELISDDKDYKYNFQYTILQVLPLDISNKEAIDCEQHFKKKLGSRAFGLNCN